MTKPAPAKYQTTPWKAYNAALKARGSLMIWLDRDTQWPGAPHGKRGRTRTFSDAAIQFCLTIKCLFNLALRQAVGMVQRLLKLAGLNWPTPDFSTVCRRQKDLQVAIPYRPTTTGLQTIWKNWSGYHRRSLVETRMRCFKLLGERVMARDFDRQVAELQIRAAILNRFTHLGTPTTVRMA